MRIVTCSVVLAAICLPPRPSAGGDGAKGFKALRDRGIHYYRKGLVGPAIAELDKARQASGGETDFSSHYWLAKALYDELRLERVFPLAREASELADTDKQQRLSDALLKELEGFYGGVTLKKAPEAKTGQGYVYLENTGGLINKRKKEVFAKLRERYRTEASTLPVTIYLPFGKYTANRVPFETKKGETAEILLIPDAEPAAGSAAAWWIAGGIATVAVAGAVTAVLLSTEEPDTPQLGTVFSPDGGI